MNGDMETRMNVAERMINALFESHEKTESELRTLATSQVLMSEAARKTEEKMSDLTVKMSETTDKLNALIDLVQRHVTEPHLRPQ